MPGIEATPLCCLDQILKNHRDSAPRRAQVEACNVLFREQSPCPSPRAGLLPQGAEEAELGPLPSAGRPGEEGRRTVQQRGGAQTLPPRVPAVLCPPAGAAPRPERGSASPTLRTSRLKPIPRARQIWRKTEWKSRERLSWLSRVLIAT